MTKVTVVIPTTERTRPYLEKCVRSLRSTVDWDIVVVSNGTPTPYPIDHYGITRRLHTATQGQCIAVNTGIAASPGSDYYLVSNDDMYYAPGWNKHLRLDYPVFSPNLIEPTNNAGSAPPFLKFDGGLTLEEFKQPDVDTYVSMISKLESGRETTGFNLPFFVRTDVWRTVGGYDEKYDPWGSNSDTDLQTKFELAGVQPMRLRDVLVYHFGSKSGTFDADKQAYWLKNWDYYTAKWNFNRDMDPRPDTWMATNLVNHELNRYHPRWEGQFSE